MVGVGIAFWTNRTDRADCIPRSLGQKKNQRDSTVELSLIKDDVDAMRRVKD